MAEGQGDTPRYTVEQVIAALSASAGVQSLAAAKLGCSNSTVTNYKKRYPEIAEALAEIEARNLDLAESQLLKALTNGNLTAVIFYLKTKGKERGYIERVEATGRGGKDLGGKGQVVIVKLPDNGRTVDAEIEPDADDDEEG